MTLDELPPLSPLYDAEDASETDKEASPTSALPSTLPSILRPTADREAPHVSLAGLRKVYHPSPPRPFAGGQNLLQRIDADDIYADDRNMSSVHYPFASRAEWQLANWLAGASLSQSEINSFLKLDYVSYLSRHRRDSSNLILGQPEPTEYNVCTRFTKPHRRTSSCTKVATSGDQDRQFPHKRTNDTLLA
jgi:hypothetical protein